MTQAVLATVYCANSLMPYPVTSAPGLAKGEGSGPDVFGPGEFGAVPGRHRTISVEMYEITRSNSILITSVPSVGWFLQPGEKLDPVLLVLDCCAEFWGLACRDRGNEN